MTREDLPNKPAVQNRREQLRRWIDERCNGSQIQFIATTADGEKQMNQGELSGLLKTKSFGEKRARKLEQQAGMPPGYLDQPAPLNRLPGPGQATLQALEPVGASTAGKIAWPFHLVSYQRLQTLRSALGARQAAEAIRDMDAFLDVVVTKWEKAAAEKKRAG